MCGRRPCRQCALRPRAVDDAPQTACGAAQCLSSSRAMPAACAHAPSPTGRPKPRPRITAAVLNIRASASAARPPRPPCPTPLLPLLRPRQLAASAHGHEVHAAQHVLLAPQHQEVDAPLQGGGAGTGVGAGAVREDAHQGCEGPGPSCGRCQRRGTRLRWRVDGRVGHNGMRAIPSCAGTRSCAALGRICTCSHAHAHSHMHARACACCRPRTHAPGTPPSPRWSLSRPPARAAEARPSSAAG